MSGRRTYIATKVHPELGLLVKVGRSEDPAARCRYLHARPFGEPLPYRCEAELHAALEPWRAWAGSDRAAWQKPLFEGVREWFYATDGVLAFLRAYVALVAEAATFDAAEAVAAHQLRRQVGAYLAEHPDATANAVWRAVGGRRNNVLRAVREAREPVPGRSAGVV